MSVSNFQDDLLQTLDKGAIWGLGKGTEAEVSRSRGTSSPTMPHRNVGKLQTIFGYQL